MKYDELIVKFLLLGLMDLVFSHIEMRYSFCSLTQLDCEPTQFGSNSSFTFGKVNESSTVFKETLSRTPSATNSRLGAPMTVACTAAEPLRWILSAYGRVIVEERESRASWTDRGLTYYYRLLMPTASGGAIRCQSSENRSAAAEVYVVDGDQDYVYYHRELYFWNTFGVRTDGGEKFVIPCTMLQFNADYPFTEMKLLKVLKREVTYILSGFTAEYPFNATFFVRTKPNADACLRCFCKRSKDTGCSQSTPHHCAQNSSCGPLGITYQLWTAARRPAIGSGNSSDLEEWAACAADFNCSKNAVTAAIRQGPSSCKPSIRTCSQLYSFVTGYPESCNGTLTSYIGKMERCIVEEIGVKVDADYDPRIGFRLNEPVVYSTMLYACPPAGRASGAYFVNYDPKNRIDTTLFFHPNGASGLPVGIVCKVPQVWMEQTMDLHMIPCVNLFDCDLQQYQWAGHLGYRRPQLEGVPISTLSKGAGIYGRVLTNYVSQGIVKCMAGFDQHLIRHPGYFFTGINFEHYFTTDDIPISALIQLTSKGGNSSTIGRLSAFTCRATTYILFPTFKFTLTYSNGSRTDIHGTGTDEYKLSSISEHNVTAQQTLNFFPTEDVTEVTCAAPWRNTSGWVTSNVITNELIQTRARSEVSSEVSNNDWALIIAVISGLLVLAAIIAVIFAFSKYRKAKAIRELTFEELSEFLHGDKSPRKGRNEGAALNIDVVGFPTEFHIQESDVTIDLDDVLGEGEFGICVSGVCRGRKVAVKMTKSKMDVDLFKEFLREVKIMSYIGRHENIIEFVGAVVERVQERVCLAVVEFSPFGDLLSFLRHNTVVGNEYANLVHQRGKSVWECAARDVKLEQVHLSYFCEQVASAMEHLGGEKVIHGDLAARNVLVFPHFTVKITDFGLSRRLYNNSKYKRKRNTAVPWRWLAPESLSFFEFSSMSDMWSYGMLTWEVFSRGKVPFTGYNYSDSFVEELHQGRRPAKPTYSTDEIYQFMMLCWSLKPSDRPLFSTATRFFRNTVDAYGRGRP